MAPASIGACGNRPREQRTGAATNPGLREPAVPADKLHVTLAGREHVVEAGTTAGDVIAVGDGPQSAAAKSGPDGQVIAARVNGMLRDLAAPLADGDDVEPV